MTKKLLLVFLSMVLILPLLATDCGVIPSKNIATVESIYYGLFSTGEIGLAVNLKPTNSAKAFTSYTVDLYESGRFRASTVVSWTDSELDVFTTKRLIFELPEDEVEPYLWAGKKLEDVFSIKVYE
jgi:hypothetical protein